ncbi:metallophosphoesterase [Treponema pectinovorum]|uniref:metallophosphoesterase n=1 Tax=Treponema pectinovorum TaxID=164 RepID=UPI0011CC2924|nr:metallophosphoesterase [Treponema pectinovorum]
MSLRENLLDICNSNFLPDYSVLMDLSSACVNLLENEDSSYRPRERTQKKFSGGLLNFCKGSKNLSVIVIPDIHARFYFLMHILDFKIEVDCKKMSVLQALEKKLVYVVCVGDLFHSEVRAYSRWKKAYAEFKAGNPTSEPMCEEMIENLKTVQIVMKLKLAFPKNFHCLKGNHENILNEEGRGNHSFYKMALEGEMFYSFMREKYDDALIYMWSCFEHSLPLCAVFSNLVVSHAEPAFVLNKTKIINFRDNPEVVLALTWTANGKAQVGSVSKSIKNLVGKDCAKVVWLAGHRPVVQRYALRQRGKFIQIHNPNMENIAFVRPLQKFNPETDILSVLKEE